ncbi:MAG: hypothetical protein ABI823_13080 [Bryobacteraceae bacterium]
MSISVLAQSVGLAADKEKDKSRFAPGPADSYKGVETHQGITMVAVPYVKEDQTRTAFGKFNPNDEGVLPVLLILENKTGKALRLDLKTEFIEASGRHLENTPARDLPYLRAPKQPKLVEESRLPIPLPRKKGKSPFSAWEIEGRAFLAKLIPPGDTVSGFFYFQTRHEPGSKMYLTGISDAQSGKEYFYFELPLEIP